MVTRLQKVLVLGAILIAVVLVIFTQGNEHFRGYGVSDWAMWVQSIGDHADTRFAAGFSEKRFGNIRTGMTTTDVSRILGQPLRRMDWDLWGPSQLGELWDFSLPRTNVWNYHSRAVIFNPTGRVELVDRSYYCDGYESWF